MEQEQRILPIIDIEGVPFYVDATKMEITEVDNAKNRINAFEMLHLEDHLEFKFDKRTKGLFEGRWDVPFDEREVATVWIRPFAAMDPEGMQWLMDQSEPNWQERYPTDLPTVDFAGTPFYIDAQRKAFRQVENNWNLIPFEFIIEPDGSHIYFDKNIKNIPFPNEMSKYKEEGLLGHSHIAIVDVPSAFDILNKTNTSKRSKVEIQSHAHHRLLPVIDIEGTPFFVDVKNETLRQVDNPHNTIRFSDMSYRRGGYAFDYDTESKNIPKQYIREYETIYIANMTQLDPEGMAERYGLTVADVQLKADVDIMVDQKQLALRERGQLPVIEISGHPFYVDLAMDSLRPKDVFTTPGIRFSEIGDYYVDQFSSYRIPYNPRTHSVEDLDYDKIVAIPKGIIIVEIPLPQQLDPIAYARIHGFEKDQILMENGLKMHHRAKEIPWEDTHIKQLIIRNLKQGLKRDFLQDLEKPKRKRGKRL